MKKHNFKPKEIKTRGIIPGSKTICGICKIHKKETIKYFDNLAKKIKEEDENYPIKKLTKREDSLNGPPYERYFTDDIANKINELIEWINKHEKES